MAEQYTVVIAGATGVVGACALRELLARENVRHVTAVGRSAGSVEHEKLASKSVRFDDEPTLRAAIPAGVQAALCCLGTTMKRAGSKEAFRAVDHDAVVAFARAARERGAQRFVMVSSLGADARSRSFYLRVKGETEVALQQLGFTQLTILRPSLIDDQGRRGEFRLAEKTLLPLARAFFSVFSQHSRYAPVPAATIGRAAVGLAFDETAARVRILESEELHRFASP